MRDSEIRASDEPGAIQTSVIFNSGRRATRNSTTADWPGARTGVRTSSPKRTGWVRTFFEAVMWHVA